MGGSLNPPAEVPREFAEQTSEIRATLKDAAALIHEQGNQRQWKPVASSPGGLDLDDDRWRPRHGRPHSPMHWGYSTCQLRIVASADYLGSLADLVARWPPSPYAPSVLARATIEASARAAWLLDRDLSRPARASRMLADRLAEEKGRYNLDRELGRPRMLQVVEVAEAYGIDMSLSDNGWPNSVAGIKYPRLGEVVLLVLPDGDRSLTIWKSYANLSHGSPFSVLSSIEVARDGDSEDFVGRIHVSLRDIASVTGTALYSFLRLLTLYGSRYGWSGSARWEREMERLVNRLEQILRRHKVP